MRAREIIENRGKLGYQEIEFVCTNPRFASATDQNHQRQLYQALKKIPGLIVLHQDWSDLEPGQISLSVIYRDPRLRKIIHRLASNVGVRVDQERSVTDDYVDRAIRKEHTGQIST